MAELILGLGCLVAVLVTLFALVFLVFTGGVALLVALMLAAVAGWAVHAGLRKAVEASGGDPDASNLPALAAVVIALAFMGGGIPYVNASHLVFLPIMDLLGPDRYLGCRDGRSYAVYKGFVQSVNPACPCSTDRDCFDGEVCDRFLRNSQKQLGDGKSRKRTQDFWHWRLPPSVPDEEAHQGQRVCVPRAWTIEPSPYFKSRLRQELDH